MSDKSERHIVTLWLTIQCLLTFFLIIVFGWENARASAILGGVVSFYLATKIVDKLDLRFLSWPQRIICWILIILFGLFVYHNRSLLLYTQDMVSQPQDAVLVTERQLELDHEHDFDVVRTPKSTAFSQVAYCFGCNTLRVTFKDSGKTYEYWDIKQDEWWNFLEADSMGAYYNKHIKRK